MTATSQAWYNCLITHVRWANQNCGIGNPVLNDILENMPTFVYAHHPISFLLVHKSCLIDLLNGWGNYSLHWLSTVLHFPRIPLGNGTKECASFSGLAAWTASGQTSCISSMYRLPLFVYLLIMNLSLLSGCWSTCKYHIPKKDVHCNLRKSVKPDDAYGPHYSATARCTWFTIFFFFFNFLGVF